LTLAACNVATIKMEVGDYNLTAPLNVGSYVTLEGGYNTGFSLKTSSTATTGAFPNRGTRIYRTNSSVEGSTGTLRLTAINVAPSSSYFRFQDLTIAVQPGATGSAISNYAVYLGSGCNNYNIVRCVIDAGTAPNGTNGAALGAAGDGGLSSTAPGGTGGIGANNGGAGGNGSTGGSNSTAGVAGSGPLGGTGGARGTPDASVCDYLMLYGANYNGQNGTNGGPGTNGVFSYSGGYMVTADGTNGSGGGGGGGAAKNTSGCGPWNGLGGDGAGAGGWKGTAAGGAFAIFSVAHGAGANIVDCNLNAVGGTGGTGSNGGTGGPGGYYYGAAGIGGSGSNGAGGNGGKGGNGSSGDACDICDLVGTTLTKTIYTDFALATQPVITADNKSCLGVTMTHNNPAAAASPTWNWGATASPTTASTTSAVTTYTSTTGRKDVIFKGNTYTGFNNMLLSAPNSGNILASATALCPGTANFSSSVAGTAGFTFAWTYTTSVAGQNATITSPAASATPITFANTTTGNVTYTVGLTITSQCCGVLPMITQTVTVYPLPVSPTASAPSVCNGGNGIFTATAPSGGSFEWYTASSGGTAISGANTTYTLTNATAPSYTMYVQAVNSGGCPGPRVSVVLTTTVVPAPTASSYTACDVGSVSVSAGTVSGATTYNWYSNAGGSTLVQTGPSLSYAQNIGTAGGSYNVWVSAVVPGCTPSALTQVTGSVTPTPILGTQNYSANDSICAGASVTMSINPTGGNGSYTYAWSPASGSTNSLTQTPAASTSYNVVVTSAGCSKTFYFPLVVNPLPAAPTASAPVVCRNSTAVVTATAPGGTYIWSSSSSMTPVLQQSTATQYTTAAIAGTSATYYVQTMNANGCKSTPTTVTINTYALPTVTITGALAVCTGTTTVLTGNGATNYAWTSGPATQNYTVSPTPGNNTYTVTGTDNNSCTNTASVTVTINPLPTATAGNNGAVCAGNSLNLTGGNNGMTTYQWNGPNSFFAANTQNPSVSSNATTAMAGTYSLTITDGNGCRSTATTSVTVNPLPTATASLSGSSVCQYGTLSLTGGANGMTTYQWNGPNSFSSSSQNPTVSANASSTMNGTYTLTVTDANGCQKTATTTSITVIAAPTISANSPTACSGTTMTGVTFVTGANTNYTWTNSNTTLGLSSASGTTNIAGFTAGTVATPTTFTITAVATNTLTGCASPSTQVSVLTINPNPTIASPATPVNPTTCGGTDGTLNGFNVTTATSYAWSGPGSYSSSSQNISGLPAGNYNVIATDALGCVVSDSYSLSDPNPPAAPNFTITPTSICEGGSATLTVTAPVGTQTYNWVGPNGPIGTGTSITISPATLADGGSYNVYTTEAGCTGSANINNAATITVNENPTAIINSNTVQQLCNESTLVLTSSSTAGGTFTLTGYQWTFGGNPIGGATASSYTVTSANPGTYGLTVTNSANCSNTQSGYNITLFPEPSLAGTTPDVVNTNCSTPTGSIGANTPAMVTSGTSDYTYTWYGPGGQLSTTTIPSTTAPALTNQSAGTYTLIVIDGNSCNDTLTATIVNANAPNAPLVASNTPNCTGSTMNPISVTGSGGTITWYTDAALSNPVSTANPYTPTNTVTDTLYVTETSSGCQSTNTQVIVTVNQTPVAPTISSNNNYCSGQPVGDVVLSNVNGVVTWYSDASLTDSIGTGSPYTSGITTTTVIYATVTNLNCVSSSVSVPVVINSLPTFNAVNMQVDSASCGGLSDGNITGIVVGGTPSFTYVWSNASGTVSTSTTTSSLQNQTAGVYTLTVTDGNGCTSSYGPVTLNSTSTPSQPTFDIATSDTVYCTGDPVTALTATTSTGIVQWYSDAGLTNSIGTGNTITPAGITTSTTIYVVANNSNCYSAAVPVSITFNPLPTVDGNDVNICTGGSVTLNGTGAASYVWDNGVTNGVSFVPGISWVYNVTGTDANGCVGTGTASVTVNALPTVGATQGTATAACAGTTVTLNGTGAVSYAWNNGVTDGVAFTPSASGSYVVTGTDANGCTNTFTVAVTVNTLPTVDAGASSDSIPCGSTNFVLTGATSNASSPQYAWSGPNIVANGTTASPTIGAPGSYTVVVTDAATGCVSAQDVITVVSNGVIAAFTPDVTSGFSPLTVNFSNQSVGAVSYAWTFGDGNTSTATAPNNTYTMGTYTVVLTAASNGCTATASVTIVVEENSSIVIPNIFSPNGDGTNDFLTITSTGIQEMNIDIFNRWGQKVYVISAPGQSWDGKLSNGQDASEGTYFYLLKAIGFDKKEYERQGPVMLVH
jgi:gliding motility-associated-like protein